MVGKNTKFYSFILVIIDTLVLLLAFTIAYILRVQYDPRPLLANVYAIDYLLAFLTIVPFWIIVFASLGLYQSNVYNRRLAEWSRVLLGVSIGILIVIGWQYVSGKIIMPARLVTVYAFIAALIFMILEREFMRFFRRYMFSRGKWVQRVL
ncbi:MAG: sugar transferase, partial [Candidatus Saccharimonadales bacterium]